jgi:hypothetical protein
MEASMGGRHEDRRRDQLKETIRDVTESVITSYAHIDLGA